MAKYLGSNKKIKIVENKLNNAKLFNLIIVN